MPGIIKRMSDMPARLEDFELYPSRFSELMDDFFNRAMSVGEHHFRPEMDVIETDKQFEIVLELPGMRKSDINISLKNNVLTVSGERRMEKESKGRRYHRIESHYGTFSRSLPLPDSIDENSVKATFKDGELLITVAKTEDKGSRKIEIK